MTCDPTIPTQLVQAAAIGLLAAAIACCAAAVAYVAKVLAEWWGWRN